MSNVKPEQPEQQHTVMPAYPLGSPQTAPTKPAQVETADEAGATETRRDAGEGGDVEDEDQDDDRTSAAASLQRPPADS